MSEKTGVKQAWSLVEFRANYKEVKLATFINSDDGEEFKSLVFLKEDKSKTLVGFSSNLGELTSKEIAKRKHDLRVVELNSGNFKLCESQDNWETVDI